MKKNLKMLKIFLIKKLQEKKKEKNNKKMRKW
jgi:hypothetical protein